MRLTAMLTYLRRNLSYWRLRPIATTFPRRLAAAYGGGERYAFRQAMRAISDVGSATRLQPYALAAACSLEELQKHEAGFSAERYHRLRVELAEAFNLFDNFTIRDLVQKDYSRHYPSRDHATE
jgi:hypothetical protein